MSGFLKIQLQDFEEVHFRDFLIAIQVHSLQKYPNLIFSSIPFFLNPHSVTQISSYLRDLEIAIMIEIVLLKNQSYNFAYLLVVCEHKLIIQMQVNTFKVSIGNQHFIVPKQLSEVSLYFNNILSLGVDEEQIEIDPKIVDRQSFLSFLKFWEINDYKEPQITKKIKTNNVEEVLDRKNYEFIKEFELESERLMNLINAASFLVSKGFKKVIATLYACKIYFQDTKRAYQQKKKELGIPENQDITFEDEEKFRQEYYMSSSIDDL